MLRDDTIDIKLLKYLDEWQESSYPNLYNYFKQEYRDKYNGMATDVKVLIDDLLADDKKLIRLDDNEKYKNLKGLSFDDFNDKYGKVGIKITTDGRIFLSDRRRSNANVNATIILAIAAAITVFFTAIPYLKVCTLSSTKINNCNSDSTCNHKSAR